MREIRFRAWIELKKEMVNVDVLAITECAYSCPDFGKHGISLAYQPSFPVMQYTGLRDKNGKDIYEGDILRVDDDFELNTGVVEWHQHGIPYIVLHYFNTPPGWGDYSFDYLKNRGPEMCIYEILGNIHQHPELLKQL